MEMNHFSNLILSINSLLLLSAITLCCSSSYFELIKLSSAQLTTTNTSCTTIERDALIAFKQSLTDPSARLSSWVADQNCCQWHGITCDFISGKVTKIDLQNSQSLNRLESCRDGPPTNWEDCYEEYQKSCLGGKISPSLLHLKYLNHLDLSLNNFEGAPIPYFFGMFKNLRYLNLSDAYFGGEVPHHLENLSKLKYLDLSYMPQLYAENLHWLSGLSSLEHLNIGWMNLSKVQPDWIHVVNSLSSLSELHLQYCGISSLNGSISFANLTSLEVLDLSHNYMFSSLPLWISNLTTLVKLDLNGNYLQGTIPKSFMELKNLKYLDLSQNQIGNGDHIPSFLRNLCKLQVLNLGSNSFGKLDEFLGGLSNCSHNNLESLDLNSNKLVGELPNSLGKFENLRYLYLLDNNLRGSLPNSIGNLSLLQYLDISYNILNGTIPLCFGQLSNLIYFRSFQNSWETVITETQLVNLTKLEFLEVGTDKGQSLVWNVSHDWIPPFRLGSLYLTNCFIGPLFPVWLRVQTQINYVAIHNAGISGTLPQEWFSNISSQIYHLDLSNNFLSGCIPSNIGDVMPNLIQLDLSKNLLNGTIPLSIRRMSNLQQLLLSDNQLSGELLDNWSKLKSLIVLDLANNNLFGEIPSSIGLLTSLSILILSNNHLHGEIPKSLQNCSLIKSIDLSENRLHGNLPSWIGGVVSKLWLLNLRSNFLTGTIPIQWCNLPLLHILDLSNNDLSREIPSCLYNWTTFNYGSDHLDIDTIHIGNYYSTYAEKAMLVMKGRELEFEANLKYVMTIDLSRNRLSGEIPNEITNFIYLNTLNLSKNYLVGSIPKNIGDMGRLETLDLSCNYLSGNIPTSLSSLTSLSHLNLSYNNLTGRIPGGMQLQTLDDPSIYEGNPFLCGSLLQAKCPGDENTDNCLPFLKRSEGHDEKNDSVMFGFFMSMVIGFPVGLNILFFTLLIKKRWRASYFSFIDGVNYHILHTIGLIAIWVIGRRRRRWRRN